MIPDSPHTLSGALEPERLEALAGLFGNCAIRNIDEGSMNSLVFFAARAGHYANILLDLPVSNCL